MKLEFKVTNNKYFNIKNVLKNHFEISERLLAKLKRNQQIFLNGKPAYVTNKIEVGDLILIDLDFEEETENIIPNKMNLEILFEDDSFLIVRFPPLNVNDVMFLFSWKMSLFMLVTFKFPILPSIIISLAPSTTSKISYPSATSA